MKSLLALLNRAFLFLSSSIYLGTGWSLVLFSFPIAPRLTPANYYLQFVPQIEAATHFLTYLTIAMLASATLWLWQSWRKPERWFPILMLAFIIAPTLLTKWYIFPLNKLMEAGIADTEMLQDTLSRWMSMNRIRVGLWTCQWIIMMWFFGSRTLKMEAQS